MRRVSLVVAALVAVAALAASEATAATVADLSGRADTLAGQLRAAAADYRGTDRLVAGDDGALGAGAGAAAGVSAAGSGVAHDLCRRGGRTV